MPGYKIIDCKQGTPEWFQSRYGIPSASNFDKIVQANGSRSKSFQDYATQLASELLTIEQDPNFSTPAMDRGKEKEEDAREAYEQRFFLKAQQIGFLLCDGYGYSPDGFIGEKGQVEIKCPLQLRHVKYLYGDILPTEYKPQVQGGLMVSEREWCDFVSFHPGFPEPKNLFVKRVYRDDAFIKKLEIAIKELNERKFEILNKIRSKYES